MDNRMTVPDGAHEARIVSIAYVGTLEKKFKDNVSNKKTLLISFEMSEVERDTQDGPIRMVLSKSYNFYLGNRATLRKDIEAILGRSLTDAETDYKNKSGLYRVTGLLDKPCNVSVKSTPWESGEKSGINTVIESVSSIPKKYLAGIPSAQRTLTNFDIRIYRTLYELNNSNLYRLQNNFVKRQIKLSKEYKQLLNSVDTTEGFQNKMQ